MPSRLKAGTSVNDEGVVILVMALLSFADSTPRAYRLKVGNASFPNSTETGAIPEIADAPRHGGPTDDVVERNQSGSESAFLPYVA